MDLSLFYRIAIPVYPWNTFPKDFVPEFPVKENLTEHADVSFLSVIQNDSKRNSFVQHRPLLNKKSGSRNWQGGKISKNKIQ